MKDQPKEPNQSSGLTPEDIVRMEDAMRAKGLPIIREKSKTRAKPVVANQADIDRRDEYHRRMANAEARGKENAKALKPFPKGVPPIDATLIPKWVIDKVQEVTETLQWPIYLFGNVGVGKTCVAAHFYREFDGSAKWMRFTQFCDRSAQLLRDGEATFWEGDQCYQYSRENWWESIGREGIYVIDDVGVGERDVIRTEALWNLLEARTRKPLILTSNLHPDKLHDQYDQRIVSRIYAGTRIFLNGPDQRAAGNEERVCEGNMPTI